MQVAKSYVWGGNQKRAYFRIAIHKSENEFLLHICWKNRTLYPNCQDIVKTQLKLKNWIQRHNQKAAPPVRFDKFGQTVVPTVEPGLGQWDTHYKFACNYCDMKFTRMRSHSLMISVQLLGPVAEDEIRTWRESSHSSLRPEDSRTLITTWT